MKADVGHFVVLAFKSQGRVAFGFFDSALTKSFSLTTKAGHLKVGIRQEKLSERIPTYTRIIHSYEEYRNILYGNNKGLSSEFRKYAILKASSFRIFQEQFKCISQHKLSAEFVKETIIKSLNEDEIKIDLTTYSQNHLKDFETNLNDIKKWTDRE